MLQTSLQCSPWPICWVPWSPWSWFFVGKPFKTSIISLSLLYYRIPFQQRFKGFKYYRPCVWVVQQIITKLLLISVLLQYLFKWRRSLGPQHDVDSWAYHAYLCWGLIFQRPNETPIIPLVLMLFNGSTRNPLCLWCSLHKLDDCQASCQLPVTRSFRSWCCCCLLVRFWTYQLLAV